MEDFIECAELVPVRKINQDLATCDDWDLLKALSTDERPWDGLITTDDSMLSNPLSLVALIQTRLTLVIAHGQGHNPVRATGLLLAHLEYICDHSMRDMAQVWRLRVSHKNHEDAWDHLKKAALRLKTTPKALLRRHGD